MTTMTLDHRNDTNSGRQFDGPAVWSRDANAFGWNSVLKDIRDMPVPGYVSPAIADDLSALPTTYIDAGSAEVFRDEAVTYATRIWTAAGRAELHVSARRIPRLRRALPPGRDLPGRPAASASG